MISALMFAAAPAMILGSFDPVVRVPRRVVHATLRRSMRARRIYLITRDHKHGKAIPLSLTLGATFAALARAATPGSRAALTLSSIGSTMAAHGAMAAAARLAARLRERAMASLTPKERELVEQRVASAPPAVLDPEERLRRIESVMRRAGEGHKQLFGDAGFRWPKNVSSPKGGAR